MYERIRNLAKKKGWSLSFLAKQMELSAGYFTDIKTGKASLSEDRIIQIAELLETTPNYLLGNTDDPTIPGSLTETQKEAIKLLKQLNDEDTAVALRVLQGLVGKK